MRGLLSGESVGRELGISVGIIYGVQVITESIPSIASIKITCKQNVASVLINKLVQVKA